MAARLGEGFRTRTSQCGAVRMLRSTIVLATSICCALSTGCSSTGFYFDTGDDEPPDGSPAVVDAPSFDAPSNAQGENSALLGIGLIGGCSGAVIDVGGDDLAPAYVLAAGHCYDPWFPNKVFTDVRAVQSFLVNYFWDTADSTIAFPVDVMQYSTMHLLDLSIWRLQVTMGELRQKGIQPFPLADDAPPMGSPIAIIGHPGGGFMRRSHCSQGKSTRIVEDEYYSNVTANGCTGVEKVSSGSPMFNDAGQIFGVLTTFSGSAHQCTLDNPCDVDSTMQVPSTRIVYGPSVTGLQKCFNAGRFDLSADGCILPRAPIPYVARGIGRYTRAVVDGSAARWNVQINGAVLPYYRFKAGPVGTTRCDVDEDYGPIMSVAAFPTIEAEITPTPGVYVLCVHGGTGTDVATTFTPLNSAAEILAEVDETSS